jgi:GMP synthase PP-ATPase subunit
MQEQERVMDMFKNHLHLPVTCVDHSKAMLDRLKTLSADHFETSPDEITWGHVGTLNHYASLLRQITDAAFKEGEHAA